MIDNLFRIVDKFSIVIYARLSKEDEGKSKEEQSKSITNQLLICHKYIKEEQKRYPNCKYIVFQELYDDGISGTTFERTSFKVLIKLIEDKKINMVITKDLSRLGRDHIITDHYLEKWFPDHNIRYVSVMENVDTYSDCLSNDIAPIINWSNEHFAKLTSKKIKKQFEVMRKEGKWCGGEPPLGYQIDKKKKYHLIVEPKGALVVKYIFSLALKNNSVDTIVKILNDEKIPIPTIFKGYKRILNQEIIDIWSSDTIKKILKNEMYLGHMIQGKTTKISHKSKIIVALPKEKWIKVLNTHEAIIDEKTFKTVQLMIKSNKNKTIKTHDYLLKGLLKCNECHHTISIQSYKERKYRYTICNYYRKYGSLKNVCTAHRFKYDEIEQIIINQLRKCCSIINKDELLLKIENKLTKKANNTVLNSEITKYRNIIKKYEKMLDMIYDDKLNGIIDDDQYRRQVKDKNNYLNYAKKHLKELQNTSLNTRNSVDYIKLINDFLLFNDINKRIIVQLIKKIIINKDGIISIYYSFKEPTI